GLAGEVHILHLMIAIAGAHRDAGSSANLSTGGTLVGDGLHVVQFDLPVFQGFDDDIEVGDGKGRARHLKNIGAQIRNLFFDEDVGALHNGHHGDEGGDTHSQAQHGERSAQLVGAQGTEALDKI